MRELSIGSEKIPHTHRFTEEELATLKTDYSESSIEIQKREEELAALKETLAPQIKELKKAAGKSLKDIRQGFRIEDRECYLLPDYDNQKVDYCDVYTDEVLMSRKMRPDERQLPLHKVG